MIEKVNRVIERLDGNEKKLYRHDERIMELERFQTGTEEQIKNLIKEISDLVSTMKWFMGVAVTALVGFFIWYVQSL